MRIALAQINVTVGDLSGNAAKIAAYGQRAAAEQCDLMVTPELALTGYPPQDLLLKQHFITEQLSLLNDHLVSQLELPTLAGFVHRDDQGRCYNAAAYIEDGRVNGVRCKTLLPTYDVFDEWRYFAPSDANRPLKINGRSCGITICEDLWDEGYRDQVAPRLAAAGIECLINLSSSPFHFGKRRERVELLRRHAQSHGIPVLYCNLVGAQDELIFDGQSIVIDHSGRLVVLGEQFAEQLLIVDLNELAAMPSHEDTSAASKDKELFEALRLGISDYCRKSGFERAVIGLSGGIDSSVVACLAAAALGADNVCGVAMPSAITAQMSTEDAEQLARKLGIEFHVVPISESIEVAKRRFVGEFGDYRRTVTVENLQARERGKILMELSNDRGGIVLATGNKTEYALGYSTLYGDMCGGLAAIGDLSKPEVYDLARYYNQRTGAAVIPERVLSRPPSAELSPGQVDPFDYERISPLVDAVVEEHAAPEAMRKRGFSDEEVDRIYGLVSMNEYKRRQAPPILRVTKKAFGIGRKMPMVNKYRW